MFFNFVGESFLEVTVHRLADHARAALCFPIFLSSVINKTCETIKIELKLIKIKMEAVLFSCGCFLIVGRRAE